MNRKIREPVVSGIFYPDNKKELMTLVKDLIGEVEEPREDSYGLIVPHAGYSFCGPLLGKAYGTLKRGDYERILLLGPVHHGTEDQLFLTESDSFSTPLGLVPVDREGVDELTSTSTRMVLGEVHHLEEHCLEVQLPFLQVLFPEIPIVPVLMGKPSLTNVHVLSRALLTIYGNTLEKTLLIISANLSASVDSQVSRKSADTLIRVIEKDDWKGLISEEHRKTITSCGAGCIAASMAMELENGRYELLARGNSSEIKGELEKEHVEYGALRISKRSVTSHT
mgnify:CR=1 FL=1